MTKAILFDFDGTLFFGTAQLNAWCFARALEQMGRPQPTQAQLDKTVGMSLDGLTQLILGSDDRALMDEFQRLVFEWMPEYVRLYIQPSQEVQQMLRELHAEASLAICSNAAPIYLLPMLTAVGIKDSFDYIWHYREGYTKATAIPELMRILNADRAVFVGDRLEDVEAARKAGIPVAGIRNAAFPWEVDVADNVAENHTELKRNIQALLQNL